MIFTQNTLFFFYTSFNEKIEVVMKIQEIYLKYKGYYAEIEAEYSHCKKTSIEWETLHLRYLIYYLVRYNIAKMQFFNPYHYRTAYRLYLEQLVVS